MQEINVLEGDMKRMVVGATGFVDFDLEACRLGKQAVSLLKRLCPQLLRGGGGGGKLKTIDNNRKQ